MICIVDPQGEANVFGWFNECVVNDRNVYIKTSNIFIDIDFVFKLIVEA